MLFAILGTHTKHPPLFVVLFGATPFEFLHDRSSSRYGSWHHTDQDVQAGSSYVAGPDDPGNKYTVVKPGGESPQSAGFPAPKKTLQISATHQEATCMHAIMSGMTGQHSMRSQDMLYSTQLLTTFLQGEHGAQTAFAFCICIPAAHHMISQP